MADTDHTDPLSAELETLIRRDTAYLTGDADGKAGVINEALFHDPERSAVYRRGLQAGRTARVDAELIERYGPEDQAATD